MNKTTKILVTAVVSAATFLQGIPGLSHIQDVGAVNDVVDNTVIAQTLTIQESTYLGNGSSSLFETVNAASLVSGKVTLKDIKGHWAESIIKEAVSKGVIKGYADGTFRPENPVSSIESYAIAFRTAGFVDESQVSSALDWRIPYLDYYKANNYDDGVYKPELTKPDELATREKALYVLLRSKGIDFGRNTEKSFARNNFDTKFKDTANSSSYALYLRYAKDMGIVKGYDGVNFGYGKNVTRAEFVKMALGIFGRTDLTSSVDYISKLAKGENTAIATAVYSGGGGGVSTSSDKITYSENATIKGQSFTDSTKIQDTGKQIYNNRWYMIQSQSYYDAMNANQTPIQVAGSFGTSQKIYNAESDGWTLSFRDGVASAKSGDIQRKIDLIRYNENFYFEDLGFDATYSVLGGVHSLQEFKLVGKQIMTNYGNYDSKYDIKTFIRVLFVASSTFDKADLYTALYLK